MRRSLTTSVVAGLGALALAGTAFAVEATDRHGGRWRTLEFETQLSDFFFQDFRPDGVREVTSIQAP